MLLKSEYNTSLCYSKVSIILLYKCYLKVSIILLISKYNTQNCKVCMNARFYDSTNLKNF